MRIYKKDQKIVVELDFWQKIYNPYAEGEDLGSKHNLIGVICGDEQGIHHLIDLNYKDDQQIGERIVSTNYSNEEFRAICKDLGLDVYEYPVCDKCHKPVFGSFTMDDKYEVLCWDCAKELEDKT